MKSNRHGGRKLPPAALPPVQRAIAQPEDYLVHKYFRRLAAKEVAMTQLVHWTDPILKQVCEPVTEFTDELIEQMQNMCRLLGDLRPGVGLAAPQVGIPLRFFVWRRTKGVWPNIRMTDTFGIAVNPVIEPYGPDESFNEGCLTFPGLLREIKRPRNCRMTYQDPNGVERKLDVGDLLARVFQHEADHLDGKILIDDPDARQAWNVLRNPTGRPEPNVND